jgi:XisI protein
MEKIKKYQRLIIQLLNQQAAPYQKVAKGEVQEQVIIDTKQKQYQWLTIGWESEEEFKNYINIHCTIKPNGKVWLMENNTDIRVAEELVKMGIPTKDIVLGFQPPSVRAMSEYAIA